MTVMEAYLEAKKQQEVKQTTYTGAPDYETYQPKESAPTTNAKRQAARIEGMLRRNRIKAAHDTFKRVERDLKRNMERREFKKLKEKVENAYEYFLKKY
jgi:hypothetical protein